eukprot:3416245-Lingulodinium_polyedra.AAC.1
MWPHRASPGGAPRPIATAHRMQVAKRLQLQGVAGTPICRGLFLEGLPKGAQRGGNMVSQWSLSLSQIGYR